MRHILLLFTLCLPVSLFAQSSPANGEVWLQMTHEAQAIAAKLDCVTPKFAPAVAGRLHIYYLLAVIDADIRNGKPDIMHGHDIMELPRALDAFYQDPANLHIPIYAAYQHVGLQFAGTPKLLVDADTVKLRKQNP